MKSVVITGISTGIGYGTAAELCRRGYRVFGSIRNDDQAERLQRELGEGFTPLLFDVTDVDAVKTAAEKVEDETGDDGLFGLINNAGISNPGPLMTLSPDSLRHMVCPL